MLPADSQESRQRLRLPYVITIDIGLNDKGLQILGAERDRAYKRQSS